MKHILKILILLLIFYQPIEIFAQTNNINNSIQINFTSSNLPIVIIDARGQEIPDEPKITVDMGIIYNGKGIRNYITDPFNNYHGKIGIEIRGSTAK